jgi:putative ABC transport system permease protein
MNSLALFGHYGVTLYRSLTRHRLYAALNVLGLAVGIAVFLTLWLDVRFETGFERWIPDARNIGVLQTYAPELKLTTTDTLGGALDELEADYPQLVGTRIWDRRATLRRGGEVTAEHIAAVDPDFFRVLDLPLVAGDKASALASPDSLLLTQAMAKRYLAPGSPLGQSLTLAFGGASHIYRVAGVLKDFPKTTDFGFGVLVPLTPQMYAADPTWRHWGTVHVETVLKFQSPAAAKAFATNLDPFVDRHAAHDIGPEAHKQFGLRLVPLPALHLLDPKDAAIVAALAAVGLLTLLLAATNYVNLATARATLRAREVAVRKVMGGTEGALAFQFLAEAVLTAVLAALIGVALCELALPLVNAAGGLSLRIDYASADGVLVAMLLAVLAIGVGAGAYPALLLARFQPATVLASARVPGGGRAARRVREGLVLFQFVIAIALMVATGVIVAQADYVRHADRGYRRDGLIIVNSFDDGQVTEAERLSLLAAWRGLPGVIGVTAGDIAPGNEDSTNVTNVRRPGAAGDGPAIHMVFTRPDFFSIYGARPVAGRLLTLGHGGDDAVPYPDAADLARDPTLPRTPVRDVVLNATAVRALGFSNAGDAIGKPLESQADDHSYRPLRVVGVIGDIRFRSPREPVPPTIYFLRTAPLGNEIAGVRYAGADPQPLIKAMAGAWRRIAPDVPFRARTADENLQLYSRPDDQHGRLFTAGAILAVGLGCVGLYGLASFTTARRVREIGIRKTLGASTLDVLRLLVGQFLRPVLLANLVAWPLAWLAMRSWLAGFDQRIALGPGYFLAATSLTLVIATATVAGQALAVARAEPAKALRHE